MKTQTEFDILLVTCQYDDARDLLLNELESGRLLDPRSDPYWPRFADRLAREIQKKTGPFGSVEFWTHLRDFFTGKIEPVWGHAHKGHILFRLGLACLPQDIARGKMELEKAYQEDVLFEKAEGGRPEARNQSAYVALTILERIEDSDFANQGIKQLFIDQLFQSFDAAIAGTTVQPELIEKALKTISPPNGLPSCLAAYRELWEARIRQIPFATVSLTGTVLEALLLADLYHRKRIAKLSNNKDILKVELGPLLDEAIRLSVFPTDSIRAAFELVRIFRNRLHPGNEFLQTYKLGPRVAWTVSVFFELSVLEWSKNFSLEPQIQATNSV